MGLKNFERRLERMVEGAFAIAFKSGLRPVELGRRLTREMDADRSVGVRGDSVAPNHFTFWIGPDDHQQFAEVYDTLSQELRDAAREHARESGYRFMGPVEVVFEVDPKRRAGTFELEARLASGPDSATSGGPGSIVLPTGDRFTLDDAIVTVGRMAESNLVLADPNVSRNHAEIRPEGDGFKVVDLGSTNGTKVNGVRVQEHVLTDGDEVSFGNTVVRFESQ